MGAAQKVVLFSWRRKQQTTYRVILRSLDIRPTWQQQQTWITYVERTLNLWIRVHIYVYLQLYLFCWCCKKSFTWKFSDFFIFTFKIQAFSSKLLPRFRHSLPSYFQYQAFSSKILARSDIFFQVTSKIRQFLPSYFQDQIFSCKILQDQTFSCKILQDQTFSCKIFQDTCKNNALSSKILEVKSDRFLQKMYGSSTGVYSQFSEWQKYPEGKHVASKNAFTQINERSRRVPKNQRWVPLVLRSAFLGVEIRDKQKVGPLVK